MRRMVRTVRVEISYSENRNSKSGNQLPCARRFSDSVHYNYYTRPALLRRARTPGRPHPRETEKSLLEISWKSADITLEITELEISCHVEIWKSVEISWKSRAFNLV